MTLCNPEKAACIKELSLFCDLLRMQTMTVVFKNFFTLSSINKGREYKVHLVPALVCMIQRKNSFAGQQGCELRPSAAHTMQILYFVSLLK